MLDKKNILIIEDDKDSREILRIYLKKWGYNVFESVEFENIVDLIADKNIQFALIDWVLQETTGIEICNMIRSKYSERYVYIIIITGKKTKDDVIEALTMGADDYLMKPFNFEELKVRLIAGERIIRHHKNLKTSYEALYQASLTDNLTGLLNRKAILEKLSTELEMAKRLKKELSIIMCDIDFFKKINDNYGHLTGDKVLRKIGEILNSNLRKYDSVGRYGGEEFLMVLPYSEIQTAKTVAKRIKKNLTNYPFEIDNLRLNITMSFGVASFECEYTITELIEKADKALYNAKNKGRNRIVLFNCNENTEKKNNYLKSGEGGI